MTWARFEDRFPWHRKVRGLSDSAFRLHVSAVCWSCEHLTDGVILRTELHLVSDVKRPTTAAKELTTAGLWDENDERTGWELHDFLTYNESRFVILARREADAERKRLGRAARPSPGQTPSRPRGVQPDSDGTPSGHDFGLPAESTVESGRPVPARPEPTPSPPTEVMPAAPRKTNRATRVPETFPPDSESATKLKEWAADACPLVEIKSETENWQDWHRAKGDTAKDWIASWRTWMRRAQKDAEQRSTRRSGASTTDQRVATGLALVEHFRQQELA